MMFVTDWFRTFIALADGETEQERPVDSFDMSAMLFGDETSPREEIIFEVSGSVRLPTIRRGDFKLMGDDMLFNISEDPAEQNNIAAEHPELIKELAARLVEVGKERPKLDLKGTLMDPPLPYVYGMKENGEVPEWLKEAVDKIRAKQPQKWKNKETPWPKAPEGAFAAKQDTER